MTTTRRTSGASTVELGRQRWPRLEQLDPLVLVPVGSLEQHGPHLPLATDTMIATAVARSAADRLSADGEQVVLVAPPVNYGASGEHEDFPGTVSIGHEALLALLTEYGRSACRWAAGLVFVNGHGGNVPTLTRAVELLRTEGRAVAWTTCADPGADAHAGHTETSILQHLAPWTVRADLAEAGVLDPVPALMRRLQREGVRQVSPNGVLGDPTTSNAGEGLRIFARLVDALLVELRALDVASNGRLVHPGRDDAPVDVVPS